jgi:hypothetical protein
MGQFFGFQRCNTQPIRIPSGLYKTCREADKVLGFSNSHFPGAAMNWDAQNNGTQYLFPNVRCVHLQLELLWFNW